MNHFCAKKAADRRPCCLSCPSLASLVWRSVLSHIQIKSTTIIIIVIGPLDSFLLSLSRSTAYRLGSVYVLACMSGCVHACTLQMFYVHVCDQRACRGGPELDLFTSLGVCLQPPFGCLLSPLTCLLSPLTCNSLLACCCLFVCCLLAYLLVACCLLSPVTCTRLPADKPPVKNCNTPNICVSLPKAPKPAKCFVSFCKVVQISKCTGRRPVNLGQITRVAWTRLVREGGCVGRFGPSHLFPPSLGCTSLHSCTLPPSTSKA